MLGTAGAVQPAGRVPSEFMLSAKASSLPPIAVWKGEAVGKVALAVEPPTFNEVVLYVQTLYATSLPVPPKKVAQLAVAVVVSILQMKASVEPPYVACNGVPAVGKLVLNVEPTIYTEGPSQVTPYPLSTKEPPRMVDHTKVPKELNLVRKASLCAPIGEPVVLGKPVPFTPT